MKTLPIYAKPREWIDELDAARNVLHRNLPLTSAFSESTSLREATVAITSIGDMVRGSVVNNDYTLDVVSTVDPVTDGTIVTEIPEYSPPAGGSSGETVDIDLGEDGIPSDPPAGEPDPNEPPPEADPESPLLDPGSPFGGSVVIGSGP